MANHMLPLLLRANNAESDLRDILFAIKLHVKQHQLNDNERILAVKLKQRISNLSDMMIAIVTENTMATNVPSQKRRKTSVPTESTAKRHFISAKTTETQIHQLPTLPIAINRANDKIDDVHYTTIKSEPGIPFEGDQNTDEIFAIHSESIKSEDPIQIIDIHDIIDHDDHVNLDDAQNDNIELNNEDLVFDSDSDSLSSDSSVSPQPHQHHTIPTVAEHRFESISSSTSSVAVRVEYNKSAFSNRMYSVSIVNCSPNVDGITYLQGCSTAFCNLFANTTHRMVVVYATLVIKFQKSNNAVKTIHLQTKSAILNLSLNVGQWFDHNVRSVLSGKIAEFHSSESGWTLYKVVELVVHVNKYTPFGGNSYIVLPKTIKNKHAVVNVKNQDNKCFMWSILAGLHKFCNPQRVSHYFPFENALNFDNIEFPVVISDVTKFEQQNSISINIYSLEKDISQKVEFNTIPVYLTQNKRDKHINLLLLQEGSNSHYCTITSLSRLVSSQVSRAKVSKYICDRCLQYFSSAEKLNAHTVHCGTFNNCPIVLPDTEKERTIVFKNFNNQFMKPLVIYAHIESISIADDTGNDQKRLPCSVGYYLKNRYQPKRSVYKYKRGMFCIEWFCIELKKISNEAQQYFNSKPHTIFVMSPENETDFQSSTHCHICTKKFEKDEFKHRFHCRFSGEFCGAAHYDCFDHSIGDRTIPIVFHNLNDNDVHILISKLNANIEGNLNILPINPGQKISFSKSHFQPKASFNEDHIQFCFLDSYRLLERPLETLISDLPKSMLSNTTHVMEMAGCTDDQIQLTHNKGVFPQHHLDSFAKYDETEIPSKTDFRNRLEEKSISDRDYSHAIQVWETFNIQNLGEYSDLCVKNAVLLLSDVFEYFRDSCHRIYTLDPAHYYSLPDLSWDAMLKYTNVKIQLLSDIDQYIFVERGLRGGITQCTGRYAKANNRYMGNDYDPLKSSEYLMHFVSNNLYEWAMMESLPLSEFQWFSTELDVMSLANDGPYGYIFEVDLKYPVSIHNRHSDYPLCAEKIIQPSSEFSKLMLTLWDKNRYVIHFRTLKQAISYGLKLKKIHKCLRFRQSKWLKSYCEFNTIQHSKADNEFDKYLFQLFNISVFEKTMENARKHREVRICDKWLGRYGANKQVSGPLFKQRTIFSEECVAIEYQPSKLVLNKPIAVGMSILEISKTIMYNFHYEYMQLKFSHDVRLMYADTDTLIYNIQCGDVYDTIKMDSHIYDTSNYPTKNIFGIPQLNRNIPGLMKDANGGVILKEFAGIRSRMYSIKLAGSTHPKEFNEIEKHITFDDYFKCLNQLARVQRCSNKVSSKKQTDPTDKNKLGPLSAKDDKRYYIPNTFSTLAWGHSGVIVAHK